jgi:hypothetical protein
MSLLGTRKRVFLGWERLGCPAAVTGQAGYLADKATRCRVRRWCQNPESAAECPHLSGALGRRILQDVF